MISVEPSFRGRRRRSLHLYLASHDEANVAALFDPEAVATEVHSGSLESLLDDLGRRGIMQLMVEGGASLHSSFLREGFVDRLVIYIGPTLLGDQGRPLFELPVPTLSLAPKLKLVETTPVGESVRLDYEINKFE